MRKAKRTRRKNPEKPVKGATAEKNTLKDPKLVERAKKGARTRAENAEINENWTLALKRSKFSDQDSKLKRIRSNLNLSQRDMTYELYLAGEKFALPKEELREPGESNKAFYTRAIPHNSYGRIERRAAYVSPKRAEKIIKILNKYSKKRSQRAAKVYALHDIFYIPDNIAKIAKNKPSKIKYLVF